MHQSDKTRREFLSRAAGLAGQVITSAAAIANGAIAHGAIAHDDDDDARRDGPADVTLRIAPVQVEAVPGRVIHTVGYNGTRPGP